MIKNKNALSSTLATILVFVVGALILAALILLIRPFF